MLLFAVLTGLFWCRAAVAPLMVETAAQPEAALGGMLSSWLKGAPWLAGAGYLFLLLINAMGITRISTRNSLYVTRSFTPIIFFVVTACGLFLSPRNVNGMIATLFFISGSRLLIAGFRRVPSFDSLLRGGFLLGLMPLFYPPALVLWTGVPAAMLIFRRSWRESVVCNVALLLPLAVYSYIVWFAGEGFTDPARQIIACLGFGQAYIPLGVGIGRMVMLCLLTLLVFLSAGTYAGMARSMRTRPARIIIYFICTLVASVLMYALPCRNAVMYPLLAANVAIIAPIYFVRNPGLISAGLYILTVVWAMAINIARMV